MVVAASVCAAGLVSSPAAATEEPAECPVGTVWTELDGCQPPYIDASVDCMNVIGIVSRVPADFRYRITVGLDGRLESGVATGPATLPAAVPWDGRLHSWEVTVDAEDDRHDFTAAGMVGPCGERPAARRTRVRVREVDRCGSGRDRVRLRWDRGEVRVVKVRVAASRWRVVARGLVAADGADFVLPERVRGDRGWERRQVYRVKLSGRPC